MPLNFERSPSVISFSFCLVFLFLHTVHAEERVHTIDLSVTHPLSCTGEWDLNTHRMYKLAYKWTRERALKDWTFQEIPSKPLLNPSRNVTLDPERSECVQLSYKTTINIPTFFYSYLPSHVLPLRVTKHICVSGSQMEERVRLSDVLIIGGFDMDIAATIKRDPNLLLASAKSELTVPWYLIPVRETVLKHIRTSIIEYTELLAEELCAP